VNILLLAHNTFREATRDRVLVGALCAGAALLLFTQVLGPLALGEGHRLTVDLGLSGITLLGVVIVVLVGASLVGKEVERRTVFNLLSRPIARYQYLVGKWAGLAATLWTTTVVLGIALWALMGLRGFASYGPSIAQAIYLAGLELTVITAVAVLFSALSTPVLSALYTVGLFMVGQWSYDLRDFAAKFPPAAAGACEIAANVVPNLPVFNMRSLAAAGQTTSFEHLGIATLYAIVYSGCVLCMATVAFEGRDFK
jgi:ABC-type transport system involved in multi-copper enzyme maturation permease subunit